MYQTYFQIQLNSTQLFPKYLGVSGFGYHAFFRGNGTRTGTGIAQCRFPKKELEPKPVGSSS